jgi:hypothetical protein
MIIDELKIRREGVTKYLNGPVSEAYADSGLKYGNTFNLMV